MTSPTTTPSTRPVVVCTSGESADADSNRQATRRAVSMSALLRVRGECGLRAWRAKRTMKKLLMQANSIAFLWQIERQRGTGLVAEVKKLPELTVRRAVVNSSIVAWCPHVQLLVRVRREGGPNWPK